MVTLLLQSLWNAIRESWSVLNTEMDAGAVCLSSTAKCWSVVEAPATTSHLHGAARTKWRQLMEYIYQENNPDVPHLAGPAIAP
jgi:hypothetical protein